MTKNVLTIICGVVLTLVLFSPPVFGQACRLAIGDAGDSEIWLEGTVGDSRIRVYLSTDPDGTMTGSYYDAKDWKPLSLEGVRGADCSLRIVEARGTVSWEGAFKNRVFEGTRRNSRSAETAPIRLQRISPEECDGKGKWSRHTDPRLPISFEYPESWRIVEGAGSLRILCPDPKALQYNNAGVRIEFTGANAHQIGRFTKYQEKWLVSSSDLGGSCDAPGAICTDARVSKQGGMTVVRGSGSTPLGRAGNSYEGLGEEEAYLLLLKDRAIYLTSVLVKERATARIVRSASPPAASGQ